MHPASFLFLMIFCSLVCVKHAAFSVPFTGGPSPLQPSLSLTHLLVSIAKVSRQWRAVLWSVWGVVRPCREGHDIRFLFLSAATTRSIILRPLSQKLTDTPLSTHTHTRHRTTQQQQQRQQQRQQRKRSDERPLSSSPSSFGT